MDLQQSDKEIKAQSATSSDGSVWANGDYVRQQVIEDRPDELDCDVVRFQNNKDKWVAFVGLLDGRPYEIFTGLQDDDEGIVLPKTVVKGKIIRQTNPDGTHRYDFQFENHGGGAVGQVQPRVLELCQAYIRGVALRNAHRPCGEAR